MKTVVQEFINQLGNLSYYNAAEGNWREETEARNECRKRVKETAARLIAMGLNPKEYSKGFLVSDSDFMP
jgi:tryptophanyl-tRNA synthetase